MSQWNNSCVERHDGRDRGRPIWWTLGFGHVCGILSKWPAHRLRLGRWKNSYVERRDGRDSGGPIYWTLELGHVWHSLQMASTSSQAQRMKQFVCGML